MSQVGKCQSSLLYARRHFICDAAASYDQLLHHYVSLDASAEVLETCQQYGDAMPNLWLLALRYFATEPDHSDELQQVVSGTSLSFSLVRCISCSICLL
ncbi:unnamed protein product [Echinostoma caproni]|uniref:FAT domain-containing protein n=1 Tax=Echinostoma caproni TaxID=27848 RepID=A0A183BCK6_9TREM|nr:unnamed protein product [Echinostoma caproni]